MVVGTKSWKMSYINLNQNCFLGEPTDKQKHRHRHTQVVNIVGPSSSSSLSSFQVAHPFATSRATLSRGAQLVRRKLWECCVCVFANKLGKEPNRTGVSFVRVWFSPSSFVLNGVQSSPNDNSLPTSTSNGSNAYYCSLPLSLICLIVRIRRTFSTRLLFATGPRARKPATQHCRNEWTRERTNERHRD